MAGVWAGGETCRERFEWVCTHACPRMTSGHCRCKLRRCAPTSPNAAGVIVAEVEDVSSGSLQRPKREALIRAARRRELDAVLVWRLDRWGRSVPDLILTLRELT